MTYDHTIRPTTINILGNSSRTATSIQATYTPSAQKELPPKQSLWQRIRAKAKEALEYIKDTLVPIATAAAALLNAWTNYRRCTGKARDSVCYA